MDGRVPTFLVNVDGVAAEATSPRGLADAQMGVWAHDSWYSLGLAEPATRAVGPDRLHPLQLAGGGRPPLAELAAL